MMFILSDSFSWFSYASCRKLDVINLAKDCKVEQ
jgi:hypothetical protein